MTTLRSFKISSLYASLLTISLVVFPPFVSAADPELMAALSVMGYGYKVKVTVNGADVGIEGGKNENRRLFNKTHEMAAQATPAIRARSFILVPGANEISIEYAKKDPKEKEELDITLQAQGYAGPLLHVVNKTKAADKLVLIVEIAEKAPVNFKPVNVSQ